MSNCWCNWCGQYAKACVSPDEHQRRQMESDSFVAENSRKSIEKMKTTEGQQEYYVDSLNRLYWLRAIGAPQSLCPQNNIVWYEKKIVRLKQSLAVVSPPSSD